MKLKTIAALLLLAHALAHPAVHALPSPAPLKQVQPWAGSRTAVPLIGGTACPACLAQRGLFAGALLALAIEPRWQPLLSLPLAPGSFLSTSVLSARAPPLR